MVYVPPGACNNICPPSPAPPALGRPTINVFSVETTLELMVKILLV